MREVKEYIFQSVEIDFLCMICYSKGPFSFLFLFSLLFKSFLVLRVYEWYGTKLKLKAIDLKVHWQGHGHWAWAVEHHLALINPKSIINFRLRGLFTATATAWRICMHCEGENVTPSLTRLIKINFPRFFLALAVAVLFDKKFIAGAQAKLKCLSRYLLASFAISQRIEIEIIIW